MLALLAVFSAGHVQAVSSVDAVNLVVNSGYYLYEGETYTPPNVVVKHDGRGYWVVPLTSGPDVITYFPVDAETGALSASPAVNRGLFGVADNLRELQLLKSSLSSGAGVDWLFTQKYQTIFNELGLSLNDNIFQLNTVEATLKGAGIGSNAAELRVSLISMSFLSAELSAAISSSYNAENTFVTSPSAENLSAMKDSYAKVFGLIGRLNDSSLSYQSGLTKLKNDISVSGLDTQTKAQLEPLLRMPQGLSALRNYNLNATQLRQGLDARFSSSSLRIDSLLEQLSQRVAKDRVHRLIYAENAKLRKETEFASLSAAQAAILAKENRQLWENQSKARELEDDYRKAVDYYNKRQFAEAEKSALRAIDDAIAVYKKGRKRDANQESGISQDLLFKAAGALLVLLVLLFLFNNRGKIGGMVAGREEETGTYK